MKYISLECVLELADSGTWGDEAPPGNGNPVLRSSNIQNSQLFLDDVAWRSIPSRDINRKKLSDGDIIVTASSGSPELIGKCAIFRQPANPQDYYFSNFTFRLRSNHEQIDPQFLFYWLTSDKARSYLKRINDTTSGLRNLNKSLYLQQEVPRLPMSEQRRIVAVLDKADALRQKRREAIDKLDPFLQSVFFEMFGDPISNSRKFECGVLRDFVRLKGGFAFRSSDYAARGIPLLRIGEVNRADLQINKLCFLPESFLQTHPTFIIQPGDLVMSLTGTTGKEDYANVIMLDNTFDRYFLNQRVALIQPDESTYTREYLLYYFKNPRVKRELTKSSRGIRQANISNEDVLMLSAPRPPIDAQRIFSGIVERTRELNKNQLRSLRRSNDLFKELQQRAFTDQL